MIFGDDKTTTDPALTKGPLSLDKATFCGNCMKAMKKVNENSFKCTKCGNLYEN